MAKPGWLPEKKIHVVIILRKDEAGFLGGDFFPQPRAQRSELFLLRMCVVCAVCVVCVPNAPHGQDRTAEAQTFQRNAEERGVSDEGYK